jgi:hypothetical protein
MLTADERYDLFKSTLVKCSSDILSKSDDLFEHTLYEDLQISVVSFLHNNMLDVLIDEGYIDETIYNKVSELREIYLGEEKGILDLGDPDRIKSSTGFRKILDLADEIIELLYI